MKDRAKYLLILPLALLLLASAAFAQETEPPEAPAFSQAELDQMLAPIALYPDALLSQMLMASTYPLEVVAAARWSRANPGLSGQEAVHAVEDRHWDPSVKALVAFPYVLAMMDEKLEWMQQLGDAFLAQQPQVMDTIQGLRRKAHAAGNLKSNEHYRVRPQGEHIVVESPYREVIYVPYYDPLVVYGPWWWAGYPPVYWGPWRGYRAHAGFVGFRWSVGVFVGPRFFFSACDWPRRRITVVHVHARHVHAALPRKVWFHDPHHRHGVKYRHKVVQQKFTHWRDAPKVRRHTHASAHPDAHRGSRFDSKGEIRRDREHGNPNRGRDRNDDRTAHVLPKHPDIGSHRVDRRKQEHRALERRLDPRAQRFEARAIPKIGAQSRVNTPMPRLGPAPRNAPIAVPKLHQVPQASFENRVERSRAHTPSRRAHAGIQTRRPAFKSNREARSGSRSPIRSSGGINKLRKLGMQ